MVWDPTKPATNSDLLSPEVRGNFAALDAALMAALTALANGQVLYKAAGPVLAGVPGSTNGYLLTLVGGVPLWQPAPSVAFPLLAPDGTAAAPSYSFAATPGAGLWVSSGSVMLATGASATLYFLTGVTLRWLIDGTGLKPAADLTLDLGGVANRVNRVWTGIGIDYTTLASAPATPAAGHVQVYAKTDKRLYQKDDAGLETALGAGAAGPSVLNRQVGNPLATTGVSNTTEKTLAQYTLPGGTLGASGLLRIKAAGDGLNTSGSATASPILRVYLGATLVFDFGITTGSNWVSSATRSGWQFECAIVALGAATLQYAHGTVLVNTFAGVSGLPGNVGTVQYIQGVVNNAVGVDLSVDQVVKVTMTNRNSHAQVDTRGHYLQIELLP